MSSEAVGSTSVATAERKRKLHWGVFLILSLLLAMPMTFYGYTWEKYDFLFHYTSWSGYAAQLKNGVMLPSWYDAANYGLGEPRYLFYPPVSIMLGGLLFLLFPAKMVAGVFMFLCSMLTCYTAWRLGKEAFGYRDSIIVATLATISFGIVNTGLMRFAMAELLALSLLPLLILNFCTMYKSNDNTSVVFFTLTTTLIWLIDVPLAVANTYVLGMVACWLCLKDRQVTLLKKYIGVQLLTMLLAAFYLIPAFFSQRYISADELGFSAENIIGYMMGGTASLLMGMISLLAMLIFLATLLFKKSAISATMEVMIAVGITGFLLQLPLVLDAFYLLPLSHTVGFIFRFYSYVSIALPFVIFFFYRSLLLRWGIGLVYCGFLVACIGYQYLQSQGSFPERPDYFQPTQAVLAAHDVGFTGYPEYVPAGTGATMVEQADSAVKHRMTATGDGCRPRIEQWHAEEKRLHLVGDSSCRVTLNTYDFPYWQTRIDGQPVSHQTANDGRMVIPVPAGVHDISVRFVRPWWLTLSGVAITALGLAIVVYLWLRTRKDSRHGTAARTP